VEGRHVTEHSTPKIDSIEIVVFTNARSRPLTKRISLNKDGKIYSDASACVMARGRAHRVKVAGVAELAAIIAKLGSSQALALGALREDLPDEVRIVTKVRLNEEEGPDIIARTADAIVYLTGRPAFVLLDYDTKDMPEAVATRLAAMGGFWEALVTVRPTLSDAAHVVRLSTSAGLRRTDTGGEFQGSGGMHGYIVARDGADSARFLKALHMRCWLAGLGWMAVGGGGQLLERSIVDRMVGAPERLVFEGAPIVVPPLSQDAVKRQPSVTEGEVLDTVAVCPPLSEAELQRYKAAKSADRQRCMPAAREARGAYVVEHAKALTARKRMPLEQAKYIVEHQCRGLLLPDVMLQFDDEELAGCTVGDVLKDPARFKGRTLADPIEGIEYGRRKAMVMVDSHSTPWINSFAHGGIRYALMAEAPPDYLDDWQSKLDDEPDDDVTEDNSASGQHNKDDKTDDASGDTSGPVDLWANFTPPPLPTGLLPAVIEDFAVEQGALQGADPAGLAMSALTVCAATISDTIKLQPKKHDPNWKESTRLWVGLIGDPSTMKTPMLNAAARPMRAIDAGNRKAYSEAKADYDKLTAEEKKTSAPPRQKRLILEDTTIEAAQEILRDNHDGVLALHDELGGWFGSMDKYSGSRGAMTDRGFWLSAFNGGPRGYDRISRGSGYIPNLSISVLGGIQPGPMRKVAEGTVDDGLLQRLIPIMLQPATVGQDKPMPGATKRYADLIDRLHEMEKTFGEIEFDDAARVIREKLERKHLDLAGLETINKKLAAHIGKYNGIFARLCLLWHCIEHPTTLPQYITGATAQRVADFLHKFLFPHALAFYAGVLGLADEDDRLKAVAGYILSRKLKFITNRDVQRGNRTMRGLSRQEVDNIFHHLDALGWISRINAQPTNWKVNPAVHTKFAARAAQETERRQHERAMISSLLGGAT
jgi:Protein of unknown function (DUF3987)